MRIRRKKHLKERLCGIKELVIVPPRDILNVKEAVKSKRYFNYSEIFSNNNPVELEIGCGKGGFIIEKARLNPNLNFLAVELLENIIVMAGEDAKEKGVTNLRFVNSGAEYLPRYIKDNSINNIYLNFSPPYPNDGYENRRLTADAKVEAYKDFLVDGGSVYQKTDDKEFFEYSFRQFKKYGFIVTDLTESLANSEIDNIETEYESKFRAKSMPIYALKAQMKKVL